MAAFDGAMDAAQRRMAELELENRQFRDYQMWDISGATILYINVSVWFDL